MLVLAALPAVAQEALLQQAQALLNSGDHAAARQLLEPREAELAGDPSYDYLLGLALLETGDPGRASLALERAVEQDARFAGARLDLARAYYASGDYRAAQTELEALRGLNPPPQAQQAIEEYLALIANRQRRLRMEYRLRTRVGYDSNANSATAAEDFLGFDLIERSRETASAFAEYGGAVTMLKPLSTRLVLDTRLNLRQRNNPGASFVNSTAGDISVGLRHVKEGETRSLRLQSYRLNIDGDLNSRGTSLNASWERNLRRRLRGGVSLRYGQTRFGDALKVKDVDQLLLGTNVLWSYGSAGRGTLGATLLAGTDDPVSDGSRYARDLYGIRLTAGWSFSPEIRAQFTAGIMQSDYDAIFFEQRFDEPREDTMTTAAVNVQWRMSPKWLMSHQVSYSNNDTDIDVFAFERVETSLNINRIWR
ncbi:MAG: tetratricopeptide repeat protein [Gammaproteobacteria bacterium]|nr:tetratricopeptide repeat protein [Gammaproteobacteria bacterium]